MSQCTRSLCPDRARAGSSHHSITILIVAGIPGLSKRSGLGCADDDVVGRGALIALRRRPNLRHRASESTVRKSLDGERDFLTELDIAYILRADIGGDVNDGAICGDDKERRTRRRDRLAQFYAARHHCSVKRRNDICVAEVGLGGVKRRLELSDPCLVAFCLCLCPLKGFARLGNRFPGTNPALRQAFARVPSELPTPEPSAAPH